MTEDHAVAVQIPAIFAATKLAEKDFHIIKSLNLDDNEVETCNHIIEEMENDTGLDSEAAMADMRFTFIEGLCANYVSKPSDTIGHRISLKVDKVLTGKYTFLNFWTHWRIFVSFDGSWNRKSHIFF